MARLVCLLLLVMTCPTWATPYYIAPGGNDSNPGTGEGVPWQHFSVAVSRLSPGDTLNVLNGTYTTEHAGTTVTGSTDVISISCGSGGNAVNGTSDSARITIKALNERQALIQASGRSPFYIFGCSYWTIEGLYLRNIDTNPGGGYDGTVMVIDQSNHITLRHNLIYGPNAWWNSHGIALYNTNNSLVEENEVYYATRHGIIQGYNSTGAVPSGNTVRRNYVHSRDHNSMPDGFTCGGSCENTIGDEGISCYPCNTSIFENNIVEDWWSGYTVQAKAQSYNLKYYGNIALRTGQYGSFGMTARADDQQNTADQMPTDVVMENNVVVQGTGIGCRTCKNLQWKNNTVLDSTGGYAADQGLSSNGEAGDGHLSVTGTNLLALNNTGEAYQISGQESQTFSFLRNFGNSGQSFPSGATNTSTSNPTMGSCKVYIPDGSNLRNAGSGGDIGANILYRYQDGVLTGVPLWDTGTGRFPCGVQVDGVNNIAGSSCFDVHTRLNVNSGGCPFPTGYGGATVLNSLIARWKLDEGTGTTMADASGLGHTGTANGGMWQAGKVGPRSLLFDGLTQQVTIASVPDLQLTTSLTLAAWIKPVSSGGGAHGRIMNKHGASANTVGYSFHLADTSLTFAINAVSGTDGLDDATTPSGTVTLGLWQHVAVTLEAGTVRFYRNGQLVSTSTLSTTALASPVPLVLGGADGRTDRGFDGSLDELRVYNFALSGADITALYRLTAGQPRHRLVLR